jgi:hypothetical protein
VERERYSYETRSTGSPVSASDGDGDGILVTDEQVVVVPDLMSVTGEMGRYLAKARLVVRLGDALFVLDAAADRDSLAGAA